MIGRVLKHYFSVSSKQIWTSGQDRDRFYTDLDYRAQRCATPVSDLKGTLQGCDLWVGEETDKKIRVTVASEVRVNHNPILINVDFYKNGNFQLYVGDVEIEHLSLNIDKSYKTVEDIHDIVNIIRKLRICKGKPKNEHVVVKYNVVENVVENGKITTCVRTETCKRLVPFQSTGCICVACHKVVITKPLRAEDFIELEDQTFKDLSQILDEVLPSASSELKELILEQKKILEAKGPSGHRWSRRTIQLALTLWTQSSKNYDSMRECGFIKLPSKQLLRLYKNAVPQESGINYKMLDWMAKEAKRQKVPSYGMRGGVLFDEMAIEEDLATVRDGKCLRLVGFVELGEEAESLRVLKDDTVEKKTAKYVLQLQFLGYSGYRFPFAHFPTRQATATDLFIVFWDAVAMLEPYGFVTDYTNMDGAITNRQFMNIHFAPFEQSARELKYKARSQLHPDKHIHLIMDIKHSLKKVRNNILRSAKEDTTNLLQHDGKDILWDMWKDAYDFDITQPLQIHQHLTRAHVHDLDGSNKMRNHLAEDVLNGDMLQLFTDYKESLGDAGMKLDGAIALVKQTSVLVRIFNDKRPILDTQDSRLRELQQVQKWFDDWEIKNREKNKSTRRCGLMCWETRDDLSSSIIGFLSLCEDRFKAPDFHSINPSRLNSDSIENNFCQQRGLHNGNNSNPNYEQYKASQNSIILGQGAVSTSRARKSNAWKRGALPYTFSTDQPLVPKAKRRPPLKDITNYNLIQLEENKAEMIPPS